MATAAYYTLGCKVNQYDTDVMRRLMEEAGFLTVSFDDPADIYIINTCTVTHVSDRKSRQMISRAHRQNPDALIVVAGCYSKVYGNDVLKLPGVSLVLGTDDRTRIVEAVNDVLSGKQYCEDHAPISLDTVQTDMSDRTRAYLKIQDGCNRFCSYCIIPYARGKLHSRSLESAERELMRLGSLGCQEVVLTGIHVMSYGADRDNKFTLTDLIRFCGKKMPVPRVRLSSLDPSLLTDELISAIAEAPNLCHQFHLSLQSGSDTVLKRMNRHYTSDQYRSVVKKIREAMPKAAITTDIIAGFPGETEEEHADTLSFVRDIGFARIHVFPYSKRSGTPAARAQNQVMPDIKKRRTSELIALANAMEFEYISGFEGSVTPVLIEEREGDALRGYTGTYIDVHIPLDTLDVPEESVIGKIVPVKLNKACPKHMIGCIIKTN